MGDSEGEKFTENVKGRMVKATGEAGIQDLTEHKGKERGLKQVAGGTVFGGISVLPKRKKGESLPCLLDMLTCGGGTEKGESITAIVKADNHTRIFPGESGV